MKTHTLLSLYSIMSSSLAILVAFLSLHPGDPGREQQAGWEEIVPGAGDGDWLQARPQSLAGEAPGARGQGASFCTLGLVADFVISFLQTAGCSNSPVHPGSESGWSAGREGPGRARWQCGAKLSVPKV